MEETKKEKKVIKVLKIIYKAICYAIITLLVLTGLFLMFYVVSGKIANAKGDDPILGLYTIISPSMTPNIKVYDVVLTTRVKNEKDIKVGDVITFYSSNEFFGGTPITHRVVDILKVNNDLVFKTKGDANQKVDDDKTYFTSIVGKVVFRIPQLGRLQFFLSSKGGWLIAIMIPSLVIISYDIYKILKLLLLKNKMITIRSEHENI